jgi:hypothetical protein
LVEGDSYHELRQQGMSPCETPYPYMIVRGYGSQVMGFYDGGSSFMTADGDAHNVEIVMPDQSNTRFEYSINDINGHSMKIEKSGSVYWFRSDDNTNTYMALQGNTCLSYQGLCFSLTRFDYENFIADKSACRASTYRWMP